MESRSCEVIYRHRGWLHEDVNKDGSITASVVRWDDGDIELTFNAVDDRGGRLYLSAFLDDPLRYDGKPDCGDYDAVIEAAEELARRLTEMVAAARTVRESVLGAA